MKIKRIEAYPFGIIFSMAVAAICLLADSGTFPVKIIVPAFIVVFVLIVEFDIWLEKFLKKQFTLSPHEKTSK